MTAAGTHPIYTWRTYKIYGPLSRQEKGWTHVYKLKRSQNVLTFTEGRRQTIVTEVLMLNAQGFC